MNIKDQLEHILLEGLPLNNLVQMLKGTKSKWPGKDLDDKDIKAFINTELTTIDPTGQKGTYVAYIARQLAAGPDRIRLMPGNLEDGPRMHDALEWYDNGIKTSRWEHPKGMENYQNWRMLEQLYNQHGKGELGRLGVVSNPELETNGMEIVAEMSINSAKKGEFSYKVMKMMEPEALAHYGQGTQWCTALNITDPETLAQKGEKPPVFVYPPWHPKHGKRRPLQLINYVKGGADHKGYPGTAAYYFRDRPQYIIYRKAPGSEWQPHLQFDGDQIKMTDDYEIGRMAASLDHIIALWQNQVANDKDAPIGILNKLRARYKPKTYLMTPKGPWSAGRRYGIGDVVDAGDNKYLCTIVHESGAKIDADKDKWTPVDEATAAELNKGRPIQRISPAGLAYARIRLPFIDPKTRKPIQINKETGEPAEKVPVENAPATEMEAVQARPRGDVPGPTTKPRTRPGVKPSPVRRPDPFKPPKPAHVPRPKNDAPAPPTTKPRTRPGVKPSPVRRPDPFKPPKPAHVPRPKNTVMSLMIEAYEDEVHPSTSSFWRDLPANKEHIFGKHGVLSKHGHDLSKASYEFTKGKAEKVRATSPRNVQRAFEMIMQREAPHAAELELLAKKAVALIWGIPLDMLQAEITNEVDLNDTEEPDTEMAELDPEIMRQIHKRITMNSMIHGSAVHDMMSIHHLIDKEIQKIDPELLRLYSMFAAGSHHGYWMLNIPEIIEQQFGAGAVGSEQVSYGPQGDEPGAEGEEGAGGAEEATPTIIAKGVMFPILAQELSKGVAELISHHGFAGMDEKTVRTIAAHAGNPKDEFYLIQVGPELWRRFLKAIPRKVAGEPGYRAKVFAALASQDPDRVHEIMTAIIEHPEEAGAMITELVADPDEFEPDEWQPEPDIEFNPEGDEGEGEGPDDYGAGLL